MKTVKFKDLKPYLKPYPVPEETNGQRYRCIPIEDYRIVIRDYGHKVEVNYIDEHIDFEGNWSLIIYDDLGDTFIKNVDELDATIYKMEKII
jgi:hypothetical protein